MTENEIRINETTMWREWITVRGLEPITLQDIDDRLAELKQQVKVEPEVKPANDVIAIIDEIIEREEKILATYPPDHTYEKLRISLRGGLTRLNEIKNRLSV